MKQIVISQGAAQVSEVPVPLVEPGSVLIRTANSCISIGTEMAGVRATAQPLWKRALKQPEAVKKVTDSLARDGFKKTYELVKSKARAEYPTGYSVSGTVIAVGEGVSGFEVGDRVAAAGAQCAFHAEVVRIPENLCVLLPENVGFEEASTVALGAIALQGVRRANPTIGETFVVMGLGILGQFTAQILRANGCKVIALDPDKSRVETATQFGADIGLTEAVTDAHGVAQLTEGYGADGVIITAAASSDELVSQAFRMTRKKGRVVLVGDVGLNLNRGDFYEKEIDFFISSSYGPGRYDSAYEERGLDYPLPYVRWTENRNMQEFLGLMSRGLIKIRELVTKVHPVGEATAAFESLKSPGYKPLLVLLGYKSEQDNNSASTHVVRVLAAPIASAKNQVVMGVIGAGSFAKSVHLPNLKNHSSVFRLKAISTRTGHSSVAIAKQFGAELAATDYREILRDSDINSVLIATRHDSHSTLALESLKAGKHVLLEKPLAINRAQLGEIKTYFEQTPQTPLLLTGFNRRFSPHATLIKAALKNRTAPMMISYRMNAGYLPKSHWTQGAEGGGRNIGEACHIYDLFTYFTGARCIGTSVDSLKSTDGYYGQSDNFSATFKFDDGSVATLHYTASGNKSFPKEQMEIHCGGLTATLDDYKSSEVLTREGRSQNCSQVSKGQEEELIRFSEAVVKGQEWPIQLWEQLQAMDMAFAVEDAFSKDAPQ